MPPRKKPGRVSEPVQVYLDRQDRALLDQVAREANISRAEVLRRGIRKMAQDLPKDRRPGWSLDLLIGAFGDDPTLPTDLSVRHDYYIYGPGRHELPHWKDRPARAD